MSKRYFSFSFLLLSFYLVSCFPAKISYVGSKQSPTNKVDVYVDENAIVRPYRIVGKGYIRNNWRGLADPEKMQAKVVNKARQNGADAVFYRETFIPTPTATSIQTYSKTDSVLKGIVSQSSTTVTPSYGYFRNEVLFLKYQ